MDVPILGTIIKILAQPVLKWLPKFLIEDMGINLHLSSIPVVCKTRKLRAQWTPELAQEIATLHSIDPTIEFIGFNTANFHGHWTGIEGHITIILTEKQQNAIAKKRRYKDRKMYIKEIENWAGVTTN